MNRRPYENEDPGVPLARYESAEKAEIGITFT